MHVFLFVCMCAYRASISSMSTSQRSESEPERDGRRGPVVRDTEAEPRMAACIAENV